MLDLWQGEQNSTRLSGREASIVALKCAGRVPTRVLPNENLHYTEKENLAAALYKQSFSLRFFFFCVPVELLALGSCLSASRNTPEKP